MIKRSFSFFIVFSLLFIMVSCSADRENNVSAEKEVSTDEVITEKTEEIISSESTVTETSSTTTEKIIKKIYFDATNEEFEELKGFLGYTWSYKSMNKFEYGKAKMSDVLPSVIELIYHYYGDNSVEIDNVSRIHNPKYYRGLVNYYISGILEEREALIKENRIVIDPIFKYEYPDYVDVGDDCFYYSVNASYFEWIALELFGIDADRENLIINEEERYMSYYCDGRYYICDFMGGRGGGDIKVRFTSKTQDDSGRYHISYNREGYDDGEIFGSGNATVGLLERNGEHYWKVFKLQYNRK